MMRLWRSAKCIGMSDHPPIPMSAPPKSSTIATAQSGLGPVEERHAHEQADRHHAARRESEHGVPERRVVRPGTRNSATSAIRTTAYTTANVSARSPKDSGTASAATTSTLIAANITIRTEPSSGSMTLVSHAKPAHAHQSSASAMQPRRRPSPRSLGSHQHGALRESEDEHQVEEELERLDGAALPRLGVEAHRVTGAGEARRSHTSLLMARSVHAAGVSSRLLTTGPAATVTVTMDRDTAAFRRPSTPAKGAVMHQVGIRSRAVAAMTTALLCAGSLSGCAFLSRASADGQRCSGERGFVHPGALRRRPVGGVLVARGQPRRRRHEPATGRVRSRQLDEGDLEGQRLDTGAESTGTLDPSVSISDDGRVVAFVAFSGDLIAADTNNRLDVIWHDRDTDQDGIYDEPGAIATELVSARPDGASATGDSAVPVLDTDGSVVAFQSDAPDLLAAPDQDTNAQADIFATTFDLANGSADRDAHRQPLARQPDSAGQRLQPAAEHRCDRHDHRVRDHGHQPRFRRHEQQFRRPRQRRHPDRSRYGCRASERLRAASRAQSRRYAHRVRLKCDQPRAGRLVRERRGVRDGLRGHGPDVARRTGCGGMSTNAGIFIPSLNERTGAVSRMHPLIRASCPSIRPARPTSSYTISRSGQRSE